MTNYSLKSYLQILLYKKNKNLQYHFSRGRKQTNYARDKPQERRRKPLKAMQQRNLSMFTGYKLTIN